MNPCRDVTWMEPHRRSLLVPAAEYLETPTPSLPESSSTRWQLAVANDLRGHSTRDGCRSVTSDATRAGDLMGANPMRCPTVRPALKKREAGLHPAEGARRRCRWRGGIGEPLLDAESQVRRV